MYKTEIERYQIKEKHTIQLQYLLFLNWILFCVTIYNIKYKYAISCFLPLPNTAYT